MALNPQRWTSASTSPAENGGFVAYGDYLTLRRMYEDVKAELDVLKEKDHV
jgi:hypothetical protein